MSGARLLRVAAVQWRAGDRLPHEPRWTWRDADLVAFPEYFRCGPSTAAHVDAAAHHDAELAACVALSRAIDATVVAGTIVAPVPRGDGALANRAYVLEHGEVRGSYDKVHPMPGEIAHGITPGDGFRVFDVAGGVRLGVLVCSDVLAPESFVRIGERDPDVIVIPTSSPYRAEDTQAEKLARDRDIFVAGARTARAFVVKVCTVGPVFGHPLQGRSLIAAPWGVMMRVPFDAEQREAELVCDLDLGQLARWRAHVRREQTRPAS